MSSDFFFYFLGITVLSLVLLFVLFPGEQSFCVSKRKFLWSIMLTRDLYGYPLKTARHSAGLNALLKNLFIIFSHI